MREYSEFLSDREIFILRNHPPMTYKALREELGISPERVRQLKVSAEYKVRAERKREIACGKASESVQISLRRKDLELLLWALRELRTPILSRALDQRRKESPEFLSGLKAVDELIPLLTEALDSV